MKLLRLALVVSLALPIVSYAAPAGDPLTLIQSRDKEIREYLAQRKLPLPHKDKEPLKVMLNDMFDYQRIALDALGARNQKAATKSEMDEFLKLFQEVTVNNSVSDKALEYYSGGRIQYKKPEAVGRRTLVSARITYKGEEIRLDYFFEPDEKKGWKIVDYSVDDASLVDTYRVSFTKIIKDHGFGELIKRLRNRRDNPDGESKVGGASKL